MGYARGVHCVGVMDLASPVCIKYEDGSRWDCPFYTRWVSMLERCYSEKYQNKFPSYIGCSVDESWHVFSKFKAWMTSQDWCNKDLDKDILYEGNKVYSENTCAFVSKEVNSIFCGNFTRKYNYPLGVDFHKSSSKFRARCRVDNRDVFLGHFQNSDAAHKAWQRAKMKQILTVAYKQDREDLKAALIRRADAIQYDIENNLETKLIK